MSVGRAPLPSLSRVTLSSNNLLPAISAVAEISSLTIEPLTMLAELTVMPLGKFPVAILLCAIAALPLMSASTIVPSKILELVIAPSWMFSLVNFFSCNSAIPNKA